MISKLLKKNEKGFTLMEMLIVVAIIAVLVAIAIPTFTSSLNKAREATDLANIRSGYAAAMTEMLLNGNYNVENGTANETTYFLMKDGSVKEGTGTNKTDAPTDAYKTLVDGSGSPAGQSITWGKDKTVSYKYDSTTKTIKITPTT